MKPLSSDQIKKIVENKVAIYNLKVDQRADKMGNGIKLTKFEFEKLPIHIQKNKQKYLRWLD